MKILLIRRGAIGDILMTTPLIRQLRQLYPSAQIDYCIANSMHNTLANNPHLSNLLYLEDSTFSAKGTFRFIKFLASIRNNYDYCFILGKNWRVNLLFKLFTNAKLIGFARERISRLILSHYVNYNDVTRYQVCYYLDLLTNSGLGTANYQDLAMDLTLTTANQLRVNTMVDDLAITNFVVVTNSGGANGFENSNIRALPDTIIETLLSILIKKSPVILLGGKFDSLRYNQYQQNLGNPANLHNFAGMLNLSESICLLSQAIHFYVTDCGAMHLGLIAGISDKMTCFFGPSNPAHILPVDTKCRVIWHDQDIFDPNYQLNGNIRDPHASFFTKINPYKVI